MHSTAYFHQAIVSLLALALLAGLGELRAESTFTEQGTSILGGANYDSRSASMADIDNDGDLDMMFQGAFGAQQLFRNNVIGTGSLSFTNISANLPAGLGSSWSAAWGDYNGDGNIDMFVGQSNTSVASGDVLRGDGLGGFTNTIFMKTDWRRLAP